MTELIRRPDSALSLDVLEDRSREYAERARASNTRRAYRSDWDVWTAWTRAHGFEPWPFSVRALRLFVTDQADDHAVSTVQRRLSALSTAYRLRMGLPERSPTPCNHPEVVKVVAGIRRTHGTRPRRKSPMVLPTLREAMTVWGDDLLGVRNRAVLTLGFALAARRTELVGIDVEHLAWEDDGVAVYLARTKTDQEGAGTTVGIPHLLVLEDVCPVRRLAEWLDAARIRRGPVFRPVYGEQALPRRLGAPAVAQVVKDTVERLGGDPREWAGHSLRSGFATQTRRAGVPAEVAMQTTRHRRQAQFEEYVRDADVFRVSALRMIDREDTA